MEPGESAVRLVEGRPAHREFIRNLSAEVFSRFGDYDQTLPPVSSLPWVETVIAEREVEPVGLAMYTVVGPRGREIDLIAIAVLPQHQSGGIGQQLLAHVESAARGLAPEGGAAVRLTVAEDNLRARRFFERSGFLPVSDGVGQYPRGQRSLALRKEL